MMLAADMACAIIKGASCWPVIVLRGARMSPAITGRVLEEGTYTGDELPALPIRAPCDPAVEKLTEPICLTTLVEHGVPVPTTVLPKESIPGPSIALVERVSTMSN
ncbi:hypothetical protein Nepgr_008154 [Nepenthes gracilis]|uniref:Uncharacterized protein n=1 Tax=Nepenthes gracilis TaxID=150966 RepID=A0AAD3XJ04_NEPGR|nr:hypothetical protein Nepgr_008154 [Nepenthes gracilis]